MLTPVLDHGLRIALIKQIQRIRHSIRCDYNSFNYPQSYEWLALFDFDEFNQALYTFIESYEHPLQNLKRILDAIDYTSLVSCIIHLCGTGYIVARGIPNVKRADESNLLTDEIIVNRINLFNSCKPNVNRIWMKMNLPFLIYTPIPRDKYNLVKRSHLRLYDLDVGLPVIYRRYYITSNPEIISSGENVLVLLPSAQALTGRCKRFGFNKILIEKAIDVNLKRLVKSGKTYHIAISGKKITMVLQECKIQFSIKPTLYTFKYLLLRGKNNHI